MKVSQLIDHLSQMDADMEVHFAYNYGDHWRTQVAPTVDSVEELCVEHSAYHSMDKIVDDDDSYDEETGDYKKDARRVVVLG